MFERLKRLYRKVSEGLDDARRPEFDVDNPPPQRSNPDPPKGDDWFARTRRASVLREARRLEAQDERDPRLTPEADREVEALFAKIRDR